MQAACGTEDTASDTDETPVSTESSSETQPSDDGALRVVVLGNSIAAGYGLDPEQAFPALLQQKADALGWDVDIVNAGVSGETTAGGLRRIDWLLRERVDVLILELGGNDGLRGLDTRVTKENLQGIIDATRKAYPDARIILAGMQLPPNLGPGYTARFREIFPDLAEENDADLIPFLLDRVGGVRRLNQPDGIHPTAEGHEVVAETVWQMLKPVLESLRVEA
jgi:acyl-CoA thioesterase-1